MLLSVRDCPTKMKRKKTWKASCALPKVSWKPWQLAGLLEGGTLLKTLLQFCCMTKITPTGQCAHLLWCPILIETITEVIVKPQQHQAGSQVKFYFIYAYTNILWQCLTVIKTRKCLRISILNLCLFPV